MLTREDMELLLAEVKYKPGYQILLKKDDPTVPSNRWYLQVEFTRKDVITGEVELGYSGKRYVSTHMAPGEFIRAVFGTLIALEEHECREHFTYQGKRIFGPHISLKALVEAANYVDIRSP